MEYKVKLWTFSYFNDDAAEVLADGLGGSAELTYECELPFPPFPGLVIKGIEATIGRVRYDVDKGLFDCEAKPEQNFCENFDIICALEPELKKESDKKVFEVVMQSYRDQGWKVDIQSVPARIKKAAKTAKKVVAGKKGAN